MSTPIFVRCKHCGNLTMVLHDGGVPMICCGEPMEVLAPNAVEAATEKHIPQVTRTGDTITVQVGSILHPMTAEHHIEFIWLQTKNGGQLKKLNPEDAPVAEFCIGDDVPVAVYEFCNLHGLWMAEVK